jgi:hypothetical protein
MITSKRMRWAGHVVHMGDTKNAYKILVKNIKGRCHLGDIGWEDNIKTYFKEMWCNGVDWVHAAQGKFSVMFLWTL